MQKRKFWEIVFQWVFPCALLVVALVLSIYEFNNKMNSAIQTVVMIRQSRSAITIPRE